MTVPRFIRAAAIAAISLGAVLQAVGQTPVTVTFQNADPGAPVIWYGSIGAYGGFYDEQWNGGPWHNANVKVVTDDFWSSVGNGNVWSANVFSASALATNPSLGEFNIGVQGYAEVAELVMAMFALPGGSGTVFGQAGISQADISAAIWFITGDPAAFTDLSATQQFLVNYVQTRFGNDPGLAETYLSSLNHLYLSVPAGHAQGTPGPYQGAEEDWLYVPEGGAALLYLLLASGICFGAIRSGGRNIAAGC